MSTLHDLKRPSRSWHRKKRVGRGQGSGLGKTAGRGGKGQKARSGNMRFEGFEGGQSPLQRRLPKFGFNSPNRTVYAVVNLSDVDTHFDAGSTVDEASLKKVGLVKGRYHGVKLLGHGALTKKVTIRVHKASEAAKSAVEKAGGAVDVLPLMAHKPEAAAKAHAGKGVKAPRQPKA
ncbi:50S ribosomal protein L15 [Myxococcus sp. CA051A]|uniref:Large ribosomal subunit protein uL15 n=1 Tax=Myxococcus llanfairpwllgwyngyllgogerychwyrndrobwllllantysiliogogogochensis TaxID=2590453 RepID=A0A540WZ93_9BACT|nr:MULTISPECIES: 50S ribosomal protein L15 [Myxococcus]NTX07856.1 50S ribosomal protein L15 [Myxococcus sp. CA040A]NTX14913.1 50S ribosomal protein L15 [Myxococcus sp. CA056]NTX38818.1 50S ribosomal protein L15 [Myxococcus sp. CA033]NTX51694.1 50S ribosomal protein L15 [Myxococcus sp. CA039A]NTX67587.1 50S ribosomal protein L15 [Myxococcus sp. CA051A]